MSIPTRAVVLCQYCEQREATATKPIPSVVVDKETFEDVRGHLLLTMEQDQRHQAMAFRDFVPGLLSRIDQLEKELAESQQIYDKVNAGLRKMFNGDLADHITNLKKIAELEKELAEARKDALMEAHRILSNSQSKPEALGKIDAAMEAKCSD